MVVENKLKSLYAFIASVPLSIIFPVDGIYFIDQVQLTVHIHKY